MNKPLELPASTKPWSLKPMHAHGAYFLVAANPEHPPLVIGRTEHGEVFVRKLMDQEKVFAL
jgi:hypothetical protein